MSIVIDTVFDIETANWDTFVLGAIYDGKQIHYFDSEDECGYALIDIGGNSWAWNGGLYDAIWLADWLRRKGIHFTASLAGTRIVRLNVTNKYGANLVLRDGCALIPMSLKKASGMVGDEISKDTGLPCICQKECGGYCSIHPGMSGSELEILKEYLGKDLYVTWDVLHHVSDKADELGYELGGTVGGSAWKTARKKLDIAPAIWLRTGDYEFARKGYYGGRVSVIKPTVDTGYRYDINSAYPAALSTVSLPIGEYGRYVRDEAVECWVNNRPGIYDAHVSVPESMSIPPLPYRSSQGRLCYPIGTFRGYWTLLELRYAESIGVTVRYINACIVWTEEQIIFTSLMNDIFDNRHKAGKKTAYGAWLKWFANSLTGKFAENPEKDRIICNPPVGDIRYCNPLDPDSKCELGACSNRCNAWRQLDTDGYLWCAPFYRLSDCSYIQWSAYLTAATRIKWHKAARAVGVGNVIYGDTDSIYCTERMADSVIGTQLGEWMYEGPLSEWYCLAPKTYRFRDENGKWHVRGKGLPNVDVESWNRFANGESVTISTGVQGIKSAARAGGALFTRRQLTRSYGGDGVWYGDRRLDHGRPNERDPRTCPVSVGEQESRQ